MKYARYLFLFSIFFITTVVFSQSGTVTGTLTDQNQLPLPGVSIIVKGTNIGTQSDFDGNYSIKCSIGDILVYTYVGQKTREVVVNAEMFGIKKNVVVYRKQKVGIIKSNAYAEAVKRRKQDVVLIPDLSNSVYEYSALGNSLNVHRIKRIDSSGEKLKITYFKPDIFYEIGYDSHIGYQFIRNNNLPEIQNRFVQGRPLNGVEVWQGPDTNEIFAFGPAITALEFDGSTFNFDQNGRLTPLGNGNGQPAIPYNNSIFNTSINVFNNIYFKVFNEKKHLTIAYKNNIRKDIFNVDQFRSNEIKANIFFRDQERRNIIKASVKLHEENNGQPNLNGFYNNSILNSLITPVSFENQQGVFLSQGVQRSFSPENFNNPLFLLSQNRNGISINTFTTSLEYKTRIFDTFNILNVLNYHYKDKKETFGLPPSTVGFEDGFFSDKSYDEAFFDAKLTIDHQFRLGSDWYLNFDSSTNFNHTTLDYNFIQESGFASTFNDPSQTFNRNEEREKNTLRLLNKAELELNNNFNLNITLQNNMFFSSVQEDALFLPALKLSIEISDVISNYSNWLNNLTIAVGYAEDVKDSPLFYRNLSHNSLLITPEESQGFTANNDLFINETIALERSNNFDIDANLGLVNGLINLGFGYYSSKNKGSVFPILENDEFELQNIANINRNGIEASLKLYINRWNSNFSFSSKFIFSKFRTEVEELLSNESRIPIAGFSNISKNLIEDESAGVIVGSAFLRDEQNRLIIDDEGFPLVDPNLQIIGDPVPDFNISFANNFKFNRFQFSFLIDMQVGGDVWNGTQNTLNFLGRSEETANLRNTTNFLFEGVTAAGNLNTQAVDFANPNTSVFNNRWVRYGFSGIAEEAIEDGSYINLREINVSYTFSNDNSKTSFFKEAKISAYAQNVFTYSAFRGATLYNNLFDHSSANGLNFFNTPLTSEIGLKINIKI